MTTVDVTAGLKPGGTLILNTERAPEELGLQGGFKFITVPATKIALEELGRPIMNTALLGAFAAASGCRLKYRPASAQPTA